MYNNNKKDKRVSCKIYEDQGKSSESNKFLAILSLSASIILIALPNLVKVLWITDRMSENDFVVFFLLPFIQLYLFIFCLIFLKRMMPKIGVTDFIYFRWNRSELYSILWLTLSIIFVFIFAYIYVKITPMKKHSSILMLGKPSIFFIAWQFIYVVILFPIIEEIFFRGYIQGILIRISRPLIAIPLQSILFGLYHFRPLLNTLPLCVIGIIFGIWQQKRNTLVPIIIAHIIINLFSFFILWKYLLL